MGKPIPWLANASADKCYDKQGEASDFSELEPLGKGGYGTVYKASSERFGVVAIKILPNTTDKQKTSNIKEITLLLNLNNTQIVKCHQAFLHNKEIWLVMELLEGGTISQICAKHQFTEPEVGYAARSILDGLAYLHSLGLIHRDLKSANILLTKEGMVKLVDFGLCVDSGNGPFCHMAGSPFWMPPEMIRNEPHSFPADVWSFGICIMEFANGVTPNRKSSLKAMFVAATGQPIPFTEPEKWSKNFTSFMKMSLETDPNKRADVKTLLDHPFVDQQTTQKKMAKMVQQCLSLPEPKKKKSASAS
jgi:serine/threonine protein kinase